MVVSLVAIHDLNIIRIIVYPAEVNTPLIIDGDRTLSLAVAFQGMQSVAQRHLEIAQAARQMDVP
jgi:hypothetical protein